MQASNLNYTTFVPTLVATIPEFQPIYVDHLAENGELLPHVLMGEFTRFLMEMVRKWRAAPTDAAGLGQTVERAIALMEDAMGSPDPKLRNLISVSFLENLLPSNEQEVQAYSDMKSLLGHQLLQELKLYEAP